MKYNIFRSEQRGGIDGIHWLDANFSFSFADWCNPSRMGFGVLRVFNDDYIKGNNGFDFHPHRDMEIVTVMLDGELTHRDSMGNERVLSKGEVQHMSAGTGIVHSEMNLAEKTSHSYQIWIEPKKYGVKPSYSEKTFDFSKEFNVLVSPDGHSNSIVMNQDAHISLVNCKDSFEYSLFNSSHGVFIFVIEGTLRVEGVDEEVHEGDSIEVEDVENVVLKGNCKVLVIEVPMK